MDAIKGWFGASVLASTVWTTVTVSFCVFELACVTGKTSPREWPEVMSWARLKPSRVRSRALEELVASLRTTL